MKPDGFLLVVGHGPLGEHEVDLHSPGSHTTADQVASYLDRDGWDIEVAEARTSNGTSADGDPFRYQDSVLLARTKAIDEIGGGPVDVRASQPGGSGRGDG